MSYCDHLPSVVRRRPSSTHLNDFSSETPGPIFFIVHVEPSVKREVENLYKGLRSLNLDGHYAHI